MKKLSDSFAKVSVLLVLFVCLPHMLGAAAEIYKDGATDAQVAVVVVVFALWWATSAIANRKKKGE